LYDLSGRDDGSLSKAQMEMSDRLYPQLVPNLPVPFSKQQIPTQNGPFKAERKFHIPLLSSLWPLLVNVLQEPQSICNKGNILQEHEIMRGVGR
jgi:hypothetical protein